MLAIGIVPIIGQILPFLLLPAFTLSFMQACRRVDQGERVHPRLLFYGFQKPQVAKLISLGFLYLIAAITTLAASTLIDNGVYWQVISGQLELTAKLIESSNMTAAMFFSLLLYIPVMMAFWFAGPLIAWEKMSLIKAIFYSFFATYRSIRAFLVYGFAWIAVGVVLPTFCIAIIALLTGNANLIILIMTPFSMVFTLIFYCSFYPTYKSVFGSPDTADTTGAPSSMIS